MQVNGLNNVSYSKTELNIEVPTKQPGSLEVFLMCPKETATGFTCVSCSCQMNFFGTRKLKIAQYTTDRLQVYESSDFVHLQRRSRLRLAPF